LNVGPQQGEYVARCTHIEIFPGACCSGNPKSTLKESRILDFSSMGSVI
jgi:hypothetical protein